MILFNKFISPAREIGFDRMVGKHHECRSRRFVHLAFS